MLSVKMFLIVCPLVFLGGFVDAIGGGGGQVIWALGLAAAVFGILGNYLGSSLAIKKSEKITRPIILGVLLLLLIKIVFSI